MEDDADVCKLENNPIAIYSVSCCIAGHTSNRCHLIPENPLGVVLMASHANISRQVPLPFHPGNAQQIRDAGAPSPYRDLLGWSSSSGLRVLHELIDELVVDALPVVLDLALDDAHDEARAVNHDVFDELQLALRASPRALLAHAPARF